MSMSIKEVAEELGISRQRVMAIEAVALRKLRAALLRMENQQGWEEILNIVKDKSEDNSIYI